MRILVKTVIGEFYLAQGPDGLFFSDANGMARRYLTFSNRNEAHRMRESEPFWKLIQGLDYAEVQIV